MKDPAEVRGKTVMKISRFMIVLVCVCLYAFVLSTKLPTWFNIFFGLFAPPSAPLSSPQIRILREIEQIKDLCGFFLKKKIFISSCNNNTYFDCSSRNIRIFIYAPISTGTNGKPVLREGLPPFLPHHTLPLVIYVGTSYAGNKLLKLKQQQ